MYIRRWMQTSLGISGRSQGLGKRKRGSRQLFLAKQHHYGELWPAAELEKISSGDPSLSAIAYGWSGLWYSGQGQCAKGAGGGKGCLLGGHTQGGLGQLRAKPARATALGEERELPPARTLSPWFRARVRACVRAYVCTGPREAREPARSKMGRDDGAAEMWFHPMWQDLASAWLMANLLVELGEPAPSGGATRPLAHRRDVCRQTPLPYLRPTLESLQLGNCHLLTDCSVFSFGFNDNQWPN